MQFTKEQSLAVYGKNPRILVSAGAGAGKTRVLVSRMAEKMTDPQNPVMADSFLVLTFTNAAAAEMKERITKELNDRLEADPSNMLLRRQIRLMKMADISTVHSFCKRLITAHFEELGLDPAFRIGEEGELFLLRQEVMEIVMEESYASEEESFLSFVEAYAPEREDKAIEDMILELYRFSRGFPERDAWFSQVLKNTKEMSDKEGFLNSESLTLLLSDTESEIDALKEVLRAGLTCFGEDQQPERYFKLLKEDEEILDQLSEAKDYEAYYDILSMSSFSALPRARKEEKEFAYLEQVKKTHDSIRERVRILQDEMFCAPVEALCEENGRLYGYMKELIRLVCRYETLYFEKKQEKNVYDFDDLEHIALKLLVECYDEDGHPVPTQTAIELAGKYKEIFVDEYQDTNLVQETIVEVLCQSKENHLFVVGDVKQSIYRFRMARPDLFLKRYEASADVDDLAVEDEEAHLTQTDSLQGGCGESMEKPVRIELRDNFRSNPQVLHSCNFFFEQLMTKEFGGLDYSKKIALRPGENGPMADHKSICEAHFLVDDEEKEQLDEEISKAEAEAAVIARQIRRLIEVDGYHYGDIVILLRSGANYAEPMADFLSAHGIPTNCESRTGYFQTREIGLMMDYLSIVDNLYQDIPMASVLLSSIGGFTEEDLVKIRTIVSIPMRPQYAIYDLLKLYMEEGSEELLKERIRTFLDQLGDFRREKKEVPIGQLLWDIYVKTGFYYHVQLLPDGERRRQNLLMLLVRAEEYEKTVFKGLFYFLRYMQQLKTYEIEPGGAGSSDGTNEMVRIMTVHKSKGLEFPVVFVSGLSKGFNLMELTSSVLYHPELGIGMEDVDLALRRKHPSFLKKAIKESIRKDSLEEELRILYVAMTRAQEKCILTGTIKEKVLDSLVDGSYQKKPMGKAMSYMDWLLPALKKNASFQKLLASRKATAEEDTGSPAEREIETNDYLKVAFTHYHELSGELTKEEKATEEASLQEFMDSLTGIASTNPIQKAFDRTYPYKAETLWKRKYTVSELKSLSQQPVEGEDEEFVEVPGQTKTTVKTEVIGEEALDLLEQTQTAVKTEVVGEEALELPEQAETTTKMELVEEEFLPAFLKKEQKNVTPTARGTIVHKIMELLPFGKIQTKKDLYEELRKIEKSYSGCKDISMPWIYKKAEAFLFSELGTRIRRLDAEGKLRQEIPFTIGVPASSIHAETSSEEFILIQGIIDVCGQEQEGILLVDYKTDYIKAGEERRLLDRYGGQMLYYKTALEQVMRQKVTESYIYSFALDTFIRVPGC